MEQHLNPDHTCFLDPIGKNRNYPESVSIPGEMTPEARLDRLERLAKLFFRAGIRYRRDLRDLGDKLNIMVNMQIKSDERFARNEERFARHEVRLVAISEKTDQRFARLADSQAQTDHNLAELIKIVRRGRNGDPQSDS